LIPRLIIICLLTGASGLLQAQLSTERSALKNLEKARWAKAYSQLRKIISKDSTNATAHYVLAQYYFAPNNSGYSIDSAYFQVLAATTSFNLATDKDRTRMKRFPLDSVILLNYRQRIDSAAFKRARVENTEHSYSYFLDFFTGAAQADEAIQLRYEAAYQEALAGNTLRDFQRYLDRYPDAARATDARRHYEQHLFNQATHDKRLESYERFLQSFPHSPHRKEAEEMIFYIRTAPGTVVAFEDFIGRHPDNHLLRKAQNILYYLVPAEQHEELATRFQNDSLRAVLQLEKSYLVPFLHNHRFGFMDKNGAEAIPSYEEEIDPAHRCGNITDDLLVLSGKIITRHGITLVREKVKSTEDIGNGFLLVEQEGCSFVIHKSGFRVGEECVEDAKLVCGKFLAIQKNNEWSIWTLTGYPLFPGPSEEIREAGNIVAMSSQNDIRLATSHKLATVADQQPVDLSDVFQEIKPWPDSLLWVRTGDFQGVFNQLLEVHIPFDQGELAPSFFGATRRDQNITLYNHQGKSVASGNDVKVQQPWIVLRTGRSWQFFDAATEKLDPVKYDSVFFRGPFVVGVLHDTLRVHIQKRTKDFLQPVQIDFIPGQDSLAFMVVTDPKQKTIYNQAGKKLFTFTSDRVQHAGHDCFIVTKKEKKGLASGSGKLLLPQEYDAVGTIKDDNLTLLKGMKFGMYNYRKKKLIKPEYTKNVMPYTADVLAVFKGGYWGFIGWDNKPLSDFEFSEVKYWSDSLALVKKMLRG
jgi:hypothetical protein